MPVADLLGARADVEAFFTDDDIEGLIHSALHCAACAQSPEDAAAAISLLDGLLGLPSISANEDAKVELRSAARRLVSIRSGPTVIVEPPRTSSNLHVHQHLFV